MSSPFKSRRVVIRLSRQKAPAKAKPQRRAAGNPTQHSAEQAPHWTVRFIFGIYLLAIVWTSVTYAAGHSYAASPVEPSQPSMRSRLGSSLAPNFFFGRRLPSVPEYVQRAARAKGVNPRIAEWIVSHESQHHPDALGDNGQSRGMWQINRIYHPEVSDDCAYDVRCSTDWSLRRIQDGYANEWSTWKYCREWYDDCPF